MTELEHANIEMRNCIDDNEQYGRKLRLCSDGVSIKEKENRTRCIDRKRYTLASQKEDMHYYLRPIS